MTKSILIIFKNELPVKDEMWWQQFETIVAPKRFEETIHKYGIHFVDLDTMVDPGSIEKALELVRKLSVVMTLDGRRVSKIINYKGFDLWWMYYDELMYKFCLPYTQYHRLLEYCKIFSKIILYEPPFGSLFKHFLDAHNCQYLISGKSPKKFPPLGTLLQAIASIPFLVWIKIKSSKLMVWSGDKLDPKLNHDFRMRFIYEELHRRNLKYVEFIRSIEPFSTVLRHALQRRRPVIYSYAIVTIVRSVASFLGWGNKHTISSIRPSVEAKDEQKFLFLVSTNYLWNVTGDIWAIHVMKFLLKFIGIKAAVLNAAVNRNFPEVLACKLLNISTIGIQHAATPKNYFVSDFMHEFDGKKLLSVDKYGLWSRWWKEYYIKNSRIYKPEQLFVSGLMCPLKNEAVSSYTTREKGRQIKVLFVAEQLAAPLEIMPYLEALMEEKDLSLYLKVRSYGDGFENWLKANRPDILEELGQENILRGSMHEAFAQCDVVVGSHSTGVLEALMCLRPPIFFNTDKWGDYFELKSLSLPCNLFADNPTELINYIKESINISPDVLKRLQKMFFGNPYKNGCKWVVDQLEDVLSNGCITK